ncbi:transposase [Lactobacillus sp. LL6]|uniref:transposase n=1 Tax=Lactobacillus sp. LL6 TaxID=2596827 RepID=UPI001F5B8C42|nr:transposase [Lactobacillus sp. LL6]
MRKTEMKYMLGLKMRAFPNHKQKKIIKKNTDASRFVYNQLLANSYTDSAIHRNKLDKKYPIPKYTVRFNRIKKCFIVHQNWRYNKKGTLITKSTKRKTGLDRITADKYPWLGDKDLDSLTAYNAQINYQSAWKTFRQVHDAGVPKFKRKSASKQSYSTNCQYVGLDKKHGEVPNLFNGTVRFLKQNPHGYCHIKLPKLGKIKVYLSKELPKAKEIRIARVTISVHSSGEYYISMLIKSNDPLASLYPKTGSALGYDLNIKNFLIDTNGNEVANPKYYRRMRDKLAKEQRILSRRCRRAKKTKHKLSECKNYQKQKLKVAQLYRRIYRQRNAFLHNLSTALIKNHDLVVGENLKSRNMLKNHALAMSISDVGWRTFIGMLEYKAPLHGKTFVLVNPAYTTQTCYDCKFVMGKKGTKKLTLQMREWDCPNCNAHHIRDYNAAKNILGKGYMALKIPDYEYKFS